MQAKSFSVIGARKDVERRISSIDGIEHTQGA